MPLPFLLGRLWHGALLLFGVSILSFAMFELAPGDYLDEMRVNPQIPPETAEAFRKQYGLDRALVPRYVHWLGSTLRGDLGLSFAYNMPVSRILWRRVGNTLLLAGFSLALTWLLAVPLGVWSAARERGWIDRPVSAFASLLASLPDLLVALACLLFAVRTGFIEVSGSLPLAIAAMTMVSFPAVFRHVRTSLHEILRSPFIGHLRAHGIPARRILFGHALPAAANPLIGLFGLSLASMTSSTLIVEVVLNWPGLGPLLLEAILGRDVHVVLAAVMLSAILLLVGNLVADLLLYAADPRIRREAA